ncbi:MAG: flagellar biosynthetic protein FliR [Candidatus Gastranaerophilales bacterium]|nr:flagellar biosynthetic protein FliR [Candidatus Gastranaerophilales bacterium]
MLDQIVRTLEQLPHFNNCLWAGLMLFPRFLGFILVAPVLSRKEVPGLIKLGFAFLLTLIFVGFFKNTPPPAEYPMLVCIILNFIFGFIIGFIAQVIFDTISAAGEMVNMQMGMQSAVMFDPSAQAQISVMGRYFIFLGTVIFIKIGGVFWIILAFQRGFDIFPLYGTVIPLAQIVDMEYLIMLTGNILFIGLQIASPIIITTLCQDIILGTISKTAPQVNVFQLSFLFKPLIGCLIMIIILPLMVNTIVEYFEYYSMIY